MTLEILEKTMNFRDHTVSLDKTQTKKEEPNYTTKKIHLPKTHRSFPAGPADIGIKNREHSIESTKPQEKIRQEPDILTKEASDKPQEKAEYKTKPRRILNIKKLDNKGKPEEINDKDESSQNINFFRIRELSCTTIIEDYLIHVLLLFLMD